MEPLPSGSRPEGEAESEQTHVEPPPAEPQGAGPTGSQASGGTMDSGRGALLQGVGTWTWTGGHEPADGHRVRTEGRRPDAGPAGHTRSGFLTPGTASPLTASTIGPRGYRLASRAQGDARTLGLRKFQIIPLRASASSCPGARPRAAPREPRPLQWPAGKSHSRCTGPNSESGHPIPGGSAGSALADRHPLSPQPTGPAKATHSRDHSPSAQANSTAHATPGLQPEGAFSPHPTNRGPCLPPTSQS